MAVLVNEKKDAGKYSVQWNASAMPGGDIFLQTADGAVHGNEADDTHEIDFGQQRLYERPASLTH